MVRKRSEFGERLAGFLEQADITQARLAKKIGLTQGTISDYLRGKAYPRYAVLIKVAAALKISIAEMTGEAPPAEKPTHRYGERIRKLRKSRKITQVQLADATGITQSNISEYENGNIDIPAEKLVAIARALRVPVHAILGYNPLERLEDVIQAVRELDKDQLLNILREKGYSNRAIRFIELLHDRDLESWQIEAIKRILARDEDKGA